MFLACPYLGRLFGLVHFIFISYLHLLGAYEFRFCLLHVKPLKCCCLVSTLHLYDQWSFFSLCMFTLTCWGHSQGSGIELCLLLYLLCVENNTHHISCETMHEHHLTDVQYEWICAMWYQDFSIMKVCAPVFLFATCLSWLIKRHHGLEGPTHVLLRKDVNCGINQSHYKSLERSITALYTLKQCHLVLILKQLV